MGGYYHSYGSKQQCKDYKGSGVFIPVYADEIVLVSGQVTELSDETIVSTPPGCRGHLKKKALVGRYCLFLLKGFSVKLKSEVKYLGFIFNRSLNCGSHLERAHDRRVLRTSALTCTKVSKVRPLLMFAAVIWWSKTEVRMIVVCWHPKEDCPCYHWDFSTCTRHRSKLLSQHYPLHINIRDMAWRSAYCLQPWIAILEIATVILSRERILNVSALLYCSIFGQYGIAIEAEIFNNLCKYYYPRGGTGDPCSCQPQTVCSTSETSDGILNIDIRIVTPPSGLECQAGFVYCCVSSQLQCGIRNLNLTSPVPPKDGQTKFGEFPWQALIINLDNDYVGGGVVLDAFHVLTAAHKVASIDKAELVVRVGDWDIQSEHEPLVHLDTRVVAVTVHPQYSPQTLVNDVAVLTLSQVLRLYPVVPHINSICLPPPSANFTGSKSVSGGMY
ncbi:Trypsin-like serine protease [Homalodisca vitripennis]|nr:Trypsin-like serine protease [Homalodisca vitripennis]